MVRKDLSLEQQTVQSCHAAIEAAQSLIPTSIEHPHVIVCGVDNENKLHKAAERLSDVGIRYRAFFEADIDNQLTALATEPVYGESRKHFKRYNLLKVS